MVGAPSFAPFAKGGMLLLYSRSPYLADSAYPTLRKEREGWGTRSFVARGKGKGAGGLPDRGGSFEALFFVKFDKIRCFWGFWGLNSWCVGQRRRPKRFLSIEKGRLVSGATYSAMGTRGNDDVVCEGFRGPETAGRSTTLPWSSGPSTAGRDDDDSVGCGSGVGAGSSAPRGADCGSGAASWDGGGWVSTDSLFCWVRIHSET